MNYDGITMKGYNEEGKYPLNDFVPYSAPTREDSNAAGVETDYLGYCLKRGPQEYYHTVDINCFQTNTKWTEGSYSKLQQYR
jgi:hypothetical protein